MKKVLFLSTALVCFLSVSQGFAFSGSDDVSKLIVDPPSSDKEVNCVNFSGEWKGSCVRQSPTGEAPKSSDLSISVTQRDCRSIVAGGEHYYIGSPKTVVQDSQNNHGGYSYTLVYDWNADKTELNYSNAMSIRSYDQGSKSMKSIPALQKMHVKLDQEGKLHLKSSSHMMGKTSLSDCVLSK